MVVRTVESFSIRLEGFDTVLESEEPVRLVEEQLMTKLRSPDRLLRWAVVKVDPEQQGYWCEGAYLAKS